jgi:hypothetical protein
MLRFLLLALALVAGPALATTTTDLSSCSGGWSIVSNVFTCTTAGGSTPSSCAISPTSSSVAASGGPIAVTGSCSGIAATSWQWNYGGQIATTNGNLVSYSRNVVPPATITATPYNGSNAGSPLTFTASAAATGGGGGGGVSACSGFTNTRVLTVDWNNPGRLFTSSAGGFGANDVVIVQFTTGANPSPSNNLPKFVMAEYVSAPSGRVAVLSTQACDFGTALGGGVNGSTTVTMPFSVGPNNTGFYPALSPNTTYYVNVKNSPGATCTVTGGCDMYVDFIKPGSGY